MERNELVLARLSNQYLLRTGERMEVECPLPDYFQEVLRKLSMRK